MPTSNNAIVNFIIIARSGIQEPPWDFGPRGDFGPTLRSPNPWSWFWKLIQTDIFPNLWYLILEMTSSQYFHSFYKIIHDNLMNNIELRSLKPISLIDVTWMTVAYWFHSYTAKFIWNDLVSIKRQFPMNWKMLIC